MLEHNGRPLGSQMTMMCGRHEADDSERSEQQEADS